MAKKTVSSKKAEPRHCDTYIHDRSYPLCLRWWLFVNRVPAVDKLLCDEKGVTTSLYANFEGERWKVNMASRFGDVGLTKRFDTDMGYEKRGVYIEQLSNFSETP